MAGRVSLNRGVQFEHQLEQKLQSAGYTIIERNYRCRWGELDLIVTSDQTLIVIEAKYRTLDHYGRAVEFVTPEKVRKIVRATEMFLCENPQYFEYSLRFDVITQDNKEITWLKNAIQIDS